VTAAFVRDPDAPLHADALLAKMRHAAGAERLRMLDAQAVAQELLGDTLPANIVMLGAAWQAGLVPVGLPALERAITLNGVAVAQNLRAFALGRLALASPEALRRLAGAGEATPDPDALDGPDGLLQRRRRFLTAYQDVALADRHAALVAQVRQAETALGGQAAQGLALTRAVAHQYARLLAAKDEYEVARLHLDSRFEALLKQQFAQWDRIVHHLAPPLLSRPGPDGRARKQAFGPWIRGAFRVLAGMKRLRGTALDVFGHTQERRLERQLARDYEALVREELLPALRPDNLALAVRLAEVVQQVRGFGPVKLANLATARAQWQALLDAWHGRSPEPSPAKTPQARRVIPVRAGRA
jgi:indolepyruvate ferredoxin oxidoreductase